MALEIYRKGNDLQAKYEEWHVGSPAPVAAGEYTKGGIESVTASGHELNKVLNEIKGIPLAEGRPVVTWFGDHAKFIVANLNY